MPTISISSMFPLTSFPIVTGLCIFFALGFAGFFILTKLKAPAPAIIGPLLFLGTARFFGFEPALPSMLRPLLSVALGIMLGLRFNIKTKGLAKIILLVLAWLAALTFFATRILVLLGLDTFSALFSATPGGLTEISLMTLSFDTNIFAVVLLQLSRMLLTLLVVPFIVQSVQKRKNAENREAVHTDTTQTAAGESTGISGAAGLSAGNATSLAVIDWLVIAAAGLFSAWLFKVIRVPSPNLIGPMVCVGIYSKLRNIKIKINPNFQKFVQIGVGGIVGLSMSRESILGFPAYIMPIIALNVIIVGGCLLLALVVYKISGWDIETCLTATAPGGMSPMILLAMEMGADSQKVVVFQMLRYVLVLLLTPLAGNLLTG